MIIVKLNQLIAEFFNLHHRLKMPIDTFHSHLQLTLIFLYLILDNYEILQTTPLLQLLLDNDNADTLPGLLPSPGYSPHDR